MRSILTIGHSNRTAEAFLRLLRAHGVTAVADVRSTPFSKRTEWARKRPLEALLREAGIGYLFMGEALGGMPPAPEAERIAAVERVIAGLERHRIALMCAEADPRRCHRGHLLAPLFLARGVDVRHIRDGGRALPHDEAGIATQAALF